MNDMTVSVNHNVSVMPVLYLQDVAGHGVSRHRLDKVESSFLKWDGVDAAIFVNKVREQIVDFGSTHFIP